MKRRLTTGLLLLALTGMSACSDMSESKTTASLEKSYLVSSVHWDEVAAADTTAHVSNNNLIMMR